MISFADAIIHEQIDEIEHVLRYGINVNEIDEYGFTYLTEAAIADNLTIAKLLIRHGANVNMKDMLGSSALHWAAENNNFALCELLLQHRADPNAYNFAGQPALVMPLLRQQEALKNLFIRYGAELSFAQDYINTKLLGHMFELVGTANIIDPKNNLVEVDFEGFILEFSLGLIAESLAQFENHFAARKLRKFNNITQLIIKILQRAAQLIKFQQYRTDLHQQRAIIRTLIQQEPLIIPISYEGHAITFIKLNNLLVKCDRREDSRLYDNIMFYQMSHPQRCSVEFISALIFQKQSFDSINDELPNILGLIPITELKVPAQISGNCSWANVEACIPALFLLLFSQSKDFKENMPRFKNLALQFFQEWRGWNQDRALQFCLQRFNESGPIRRASFAEILAAILFQTCTAESSSNQERIAKILPVFHDPQYAPILQNYIKSYCYEDKNEEGLRLLQILKDFNYL